jgi:MoaA/NifB/PqqE/SkfB family radical SAM enzyme
MYHYEQIREVHLELTSRCNAACPQCPRNLPGAGPNPELPLTELSLEDVRAIFEPAFIKRLKKIYLCGNYGDPMVAREVLEVLEYFRSAHPALELGFHTNGSGRTPEFWSRLAKVVSYCRFGIDGLGDTNALYRRQTDWERILQSVRAFIGAGGVAEWDFIVFRHNEHQVEEARSLAREMGFKRFFAKRTSRFYSPKLGRNQDKLDVLDRDGQVLYQIEPPQNQEWRNVEAGELGAAVEGPERYRTYLEGANVSCKVLAPAKIYVSAEGLVFPCCFMANLYPPGRPTGSAQIWRFLKQLPGGKDALDARRHSLEQIIEGPFFQQTVPTGWTKGSLEGSRLEVCARVCGDFDLHRAQYSASLL